MQNIQQQIVEHVEVYYEHLLKLANCLQIRATCVFLTIVFKVGLLPYLWLTTIGMKCDTLIKHKKTAIVYEESGPINVNYDVLPTTLETNGITKLVVHVVTTKALYTCINCGKVGHILDTYYITKRKMFY